MALVTSSIKYTSRTFNTIMQDINSVPELAGKPEWFKRLIAGVGDMLSMINNGAANNAYLRTAFTRQAVTDLCELIGYEIPDATTSSGTMIFQLSASATYPKTILRSDIAAMSTTGLRFENESDVTYTPETAQADNQYTNNSTYTVDRDFMSGEKVRVSGGIPPELNSSTDYYVIRLDATHIRLANSSQNAMTRNPVTFSNPVPPFNFVTFTIYSVRVPCKQQEYKPSVPLGSSDGVTQWQEFDLPDSGVLRNTLTVSVNDESWNRVDTLVFSLSLSKDYQHVQLLQRKSFIRFGNNEYGAIPTNFPIMASYAVGGGFKSNVRQIGAINVYAGSDPDVTGCFNGTEFLGGGDEQYIEVAKRMAPGMLRSRDRFEVPEDGEFLSVYYGNVAMAKCYPNFYGVLSAKVVCIAKGGGNPDPAARQTLQDMLIARSILNSIDVRVEEADIVKRDIFIDVHVTSGEDVEFIRSLTWLGAYIFFNETSQEILDAYMSGGIDAVVSLVEPIFQTTVTTKMYDSVTRMMDDLMRLGTRQFGETIQASVPVAFLQGNIEGISYMSITTSAGGLPLFHAADAISSVNSVVVNAA